MKPNKAGGMFSLIMCATLAALCSCHAAPVGVKRAPLKRPDPAPVLAAHEVKDATITQSTHRIDTLAAPAPEPIPQQIAKETAQIRDAIATAPAAQLSTLSTAYTTALDQYEHTLGNLTAKLDKETLKTTRADKRWLRSTAITLLLAFAITIIFGRERAAARTWPLALLGIGLFALAEVIGTPAFQIGTLALLAAAVAYATYWLIDRHRAGTLAQKLQKRADTLREIIPILDQAYENASDDVKRLLDRNLFARFSDAFDNDAKAQIHEIRQEAAQGT